MGRWGAGAARVAAALGSLAWGACGAWGDLAPPRLVEARVEGSGGFLTLGFDEEVARAAAGGDWLAPDDPAPAVKVDQARVEVALPAQLEPGKAYVWTAEVEDRQHNLSAVAGRFYGPNGHPAGLRLNEVRVVGSGPKTDFIELRVTAAGSLGGWTLEVWAAPQKPQRLVLPDLEVKEGTLVTVRYKDGPGTEAVPGPVFRQPDQKGLPGTKGLALLRPSPDGAPVDGLAWAAVPGAAEALGQAAGWTKGPELNPGDCTATRTWCRRPGEVGTWYVTASGKATPGRPNSPEVWSPKPSSRSSKTKTTKPRVRGRPRGRGGLGGPGSRSRSGRGGGALRRLPAPPRPPALGEGPEPTSPGVPPRRGPRPGGPPVPSARARTPRAPGAAWPEFRGPRGEAGPTTAAAGRPGPPRPGRGPGGCRRRGAARPSG